MNSKHRPALEVDVALAERGTTARYLTVAHLNPKRQGSLEDQFSFFASHLAARGVPADFLFSTFPILPVQELFRRRGGGVGRLDFDRPVAAAAALYRFIRRGRYQVVHFHFVRPHSPLMVAAKAAGAHVILTEHMALPVRSALKPKARVRRLFNHTVDVRLPVSAPLAKVIAAADGVAPKALVTVVNGVDLERFVPAPQLRAPCRAELGLGENEPVVLCVARFAEVKGVDVLVESLARAQPGSALSRARVLLAGDGPRRPVIEKLARDRGVFDRLVFLGLRSDLERIYPVADVAVVPSAGWESCSLSVLEAQACGVPLVATSTGGTPNLVKDGATAVLVPPRDPSALALAMNVLLTDAQVRTRMSTFARAFVESHFGLERWAEQVFAVSRDRFPNAVEPPTTEAPMLPQSASTGG